MRALFRSVLSCFSTRCARSAAFSLQAVARRLAAARERPVPALALGLGEFAYGDHLTALAGGGVIVPDYREGLHLFTAEGEHRGLRFAARFDCPTAVALDDEGVSWVILHDDCALARVHVDWATMEISTESPSYGTRTLLVGGPWMSHFWRCGVGCV